MNICDDIHSSCEDKEEEMEERRKVEIKLIEETGKKLLGKKE